MMFAKSILVVTYFEEENLESWGLICFLHPLMQRGEDNAAVLQGKLTSSDVPDTAERVPGLAQHGGQHGHLHCRH